jgi:AcrR family transcriptional regulator
MAKRKYRLGKRAEQQEQTRQRIVDAIVALHEEVGPRQTTISAVAERAGVERLTVYRHFPDEAGLYGACSARFTELNPPPDPLTWQQITDPAARTGTALEALYRYYRHAARMLDQIYRDVDLIPALKEVMSDFEGYLDAIADDLLAGWRPPHPRADTTRAVLRHAISFRTWQSLSLQGLSDERIARMMSELIARESAGH